MFFHGHRSGRLSLTLLDCKWPFDPMQVVCDVSNCGYMEDFSNSIRSQHHAESKSVAR
jgi:hypothetical protein